MFWFQQVSFGKCKQRDYWSWAQHPAIQENMQSTWGKTSFTSSVFLNLDFIIEAQIQTPKAAHTKLSLIKNIIFHLFIDYMAAITFQFKILPLLKNALLTDNSDFQLLCSQNICHMYVGYVLNYYTTCASFFLYDKFNNMINK